MNDELNELSDKELSRVFALEIAGWEHRPARDSLNRWYNEMGDMVWNYEDDKLGDPMFAHSADAVLPWLESTGWIEANAWSAEAGKPAPLRWRVRVLTRNQFIEGAGQTFARAACIAIILAKRNKES